MVFLSYVKLKKKELTDIIFINVILAFLFGLTYVRVEGSTNFVGIFLAFFIFLFITQTLRLMVMKYIGYRNAFEIDLYQSYLDRFWFYKWHRLSFYLGGKHGEALSSSAINKITKGKSKEFKGFPMSYISILLYIITFGVFIFPAVWNYKIKKIPHLHTGTQQKFEYGLSFLHNIEISDHRIAKALLGGFIFYFVFAVFMKVFFMDVLGSLFYWFMFTLYWIAFWTIMPIISNEGSSLVKRSLYAWFTAFVILVLGMISILVLNDIDAILGTTLFGSVIVLFFLLWKHLMK